MTPPTRSRCPMSRSPAGKASAWCASAWKPSTTAAANSIRLKFNEELSYKEISARTGLNIGHVGYLLHHALKAIADELARNGVVP